MDEPDELRSLRERAYGPNPDIHDDPAALARLRELELASAHATTGGAASRDLVPRPEDRDAAAPAAAAFGAAYTDAPQVSRPGDDDETPPALAEAGPAAAPPAPRRSRGRGAWIWAGALTAALVAGAGITYVTMQARPGSTATIGIDSDGPWPENLGNRQNGAEVFEEFHGLRVVLSQQDWAAAAATPCLFILTATSEASIIGAGCGAGDFAPIAAIEITSRSPAALRERFPEGTALQFELDGDRVVIYSDGP